MNAELRKNVTLEALFQGMVEGVVLHDAEGTILDCNPAALKILGVTREQVIGKSCFDNRLSGEDGCPFPLEGHPVSMAITSGEAQRNVTVGLLRTERDVCWLRLNVSLIFEEGGESLVQILCTFSDVTTERELAREIERSKTRMEVVLRAAKFGVWEWDLRAGVLIWDEHMYEIFGLKPENFGGDYEAFECRVVAEDLPSFRQALWRAFAEREEHFLFEFRIRHSGSEDRNVRIEADCFYDARGEISRMVGVSWDVTELVLQGREMEEKNRFLEDLTANLPGMIHSSELQPGDLKIRSIYVSEGSKLLYGMSPEEILKGENVLQNMIHPEDQSVFEREMQRTAKTLVPTKMKLRMMLPDGSMKWVMTYPRPRKLADGTIRWNSIHIDVTEVHQREERLELFERIVEGSSDFVGVVTMKGRSLYENKAWNERLGSSSDLADIGKRHPGWAEELVTKTGIPEAIRTGTWSGENAFFGKDGEEIPVLQSITCHYDKDGQPSYISTIVRDISLLKKTQFDLKQVFDAVNKAAIVATTDSQGKIIEVNANFCRISGYSQEELVGKDHRMVKSGNHPKEFFRDMWTKIQSGQTWQGEIQNRKKDGSFYWVQSVICPLRDAQGKIEKYMAIRFDLTEQKAMQDKLIYSSKMSSLGEMSGGIAHEINNPLAIIVGNAEQIRMAAAQGRLEQKMAISYAEVIENTAQRIVKIVRGLRLFARDAEGDPFESTKVGTLIEETLAFCQTRFVNRGVKIEVGEFDLDLRLDCRPAQISQVLLNLLGNAFDAIEHLEEKWIRIDVKETGPSVEISVTDSGPGIPEEIRTKIMEPFFTTKDVGRGTGLGLSIARGLVDGHDGVIEVDEECANTRFIVRFPKSQAKENKSAA